MNDNTLLLIGLGAAVWFMTRKGDESDAPKSGGGVFDGYAPVTPYPTMPEIITAPVTGGGTVVALSTPVNVGGSVQYRLGDPVTAKDRATTRYELFAKGF